MNNLYLQEEEKEALKQYSKYFDTIKELYHDYLGTPYFDGPSAERWFLVYNRKLIEAIKEDLKKEVLKELLEATLKTENKTERKGGKI